MPVTTTFTLNINGGRRTITAEGDKTLLSVLRDDICLTGAKRGCNQGVCGACTISLDERPVRSCLCLAANCADQHILTVEGLARDRIGAALQAAFLATGAVQCGFCISGMLISARRLLADERQPSVEQIRLALSGNLCRCSGYRKIVDAVRLASEELGK
jgi:aerobic-type carbon monoxide dehydrogenase small subunit (CoxS/CutS family)